MTQMQVSTFLAKVRIAIEEGNFEILPRVENMITKRKYGWTTEEQEDMVKQLEPKDLIKGPVLDEFIPSEDVCLFMKIKNKGMIKMIKNKSEKLILKEEYVKYTVKDEEIEVLEKYYIDTDTNERVYDRELSIENDIVAYDEYKRKKGLLTVAEIKNIRKKYNLNQKEYALAIGVGEVTVHRFENGTIQTESIDAIMRLSDEPINMMRLVLQNQEKLGVEVFERVMKIIENLIELKKHKIADINYSELSSLDFKTEDVDTVAEAIIDEYNTQIYEKEKNISTELSRITPLELQKHLYYVNGISLSVYNKPAFTNDILAWDYGPVVQEIYEKYKYLGKNEIISEPQIINISEGMKAIIKIVVDAYGQYTGKQLINLTHDEKPWKTTEKNGIIEESRIKAYFDDVYLNFL